MNINLQKDAISVAIEYLNKKHGITIDDQYYSNIRAWRSWWEGYVKSFHTYKELGADDMPHERELYKLGMAKRISEDWASLLLNEKTEITIDDSSTSEWLLGKDGERDTGGVLGDCNFWAEGNELLEKAFAYGTGAFIARAEGARLTDGGKIIPDKNCKPSIEYVDALQIVPLSVEKSKVTEVAFVSDFLKMGKPCLYIESHTKAPSGNYQIENEYFEIGDKGLEPMELPAGVAAVLDTGSPLPWFALIYPNITCNIPSCNGLGMSVYANAIDNLKGVDLAFNNFLRDFKLGGKKVFYNKAMLRTSADGSKITPDDVCQQLFTQVGDGIDFDAKQMVQEFNPSLRVAENRDGVQAQLDYLSFKCGMGTKRYRFEASGVKTATEYNGEKQELVQHANRHIIVLQTALRQLCQTLIYIGKVFCAAPVNPDAAISIIFDDGFVIDEEAKAAKDMQLVGAGIMEKWEYRVEHFGETEEEAKAVIAGMQTAPDNPFNFA